MTDHFVNIGGDIWVRASQVEAVYRSSRGGAIVTTIQGHDYATDLTQKQVLDRICLEEER